MLLDTLELKVVDMTFAYPGTVKPVFKEVNLTISQGKLIMVVGPHGSGKSTLLSFLGHTSFPKAKDGHVFIPTFLRVLQVSQDICLLDQSVWANLTFGFPQAARDRVKGILNLLEMHLTTKLLHQELACLEVEQDDNSNVSPLMGSKEGSQEEEEEAQEEQGEAEALWQDKLCRSDKAKLHLARALIVNPDVLVLQRPLSHYDEPESKKVMKVIQSHVKNRGLCLPEGTLSRRRPRTCFLTPESLEQTRSAQVIYRLDAKTRSVEMTSYQNLTLGDF